MPSTAMKDAPKQLRKVRKRGIEKVFHDSPDQGEQEKIFDQDRKRRLALQKAYSGAMDPQYGKPLSTMRDMGEGFSSTYTASGNMKWDHGRAFSYGTNEKNLYDDVK